MNIKKIADGLEEIMKDTYKKLENKIDNNPEIKRASGDLATLKGVVNFIDDEFEKSLSYIIDFVRQYDLKEVNEIYSDYYLKIHDMCMNKIKNIMK